MRHSNILGRCTGSAGSAQLYAAGIAANYLLNWLSHAAVEELVSKKSGLSPEEFEAFKKDTSARASSVYMALLTPLKNYLSSIFAQMGVGASEASGLSMSFDAGVKLPIFLGFVVTSYDQLKKLGFAGFELAKQLGLMTLDSMKLSIQGLLGITEKTMPRYEFAMGYPVVFTQSTRLDCGPTDPYCLNSERERRAPEREAKEKEQWSKPDLFVQALTTFVTTGTGVAAGIAIVALAAYLSGIIMPVVSSSLLAPHFNATVAAAVNSALSTYVESKVMTTLRDWFVDLMAQLPLLGTDDGILNKGLEEEVRWGHKTYYAHGGVAPAQLKFVSSLFSMMGVRG